MPRSFSSLSRLGARFSNGRRDPRVYVRVILGALLMANIVAALIAFRPWGGSLEDLNREQADLQKQVLDLQSRVRRTKALADRVEQARQQDEKFSAQYMLDRRTTFSILESELNRLAKDAGIKTKEKSVVMEPVEGSDSLSQMTISAGFEGTYQNLTKFVNLLDKSPRFLIIEQMVAAPQQTGPMISVSMKIDMFVKDETGGAS